jgi:hypothetical protein
MKNLNKSQKRFATLFLLSLVLGTTAITAFRVQADGKTVIDPAPLDEIAYPSAEMTQNAPALTSLAAMYAPVDNQENWIKSVCVGMTKGGCDYFKTHQAVSVWGEQLGNIGSSAGYISNVTVIDEKHEVWIATTSIFTQGPNDNHSTETTFDVHVLVERGADQKWYLDRVLIGPSIDLAPETSAGSSFLLGKETSELLQYKTK